MTGTPGVRVRVAGPAGNPRGVGTVLWLEGESWRGPARAVTAGSGHWSTDGGTLVLARPAAARTLVVRDGGGRLRRLPLPAPGADLVVR